MAAAVTLAWTYSPEGAIVLGEEGPVTHLGCDGNTTYDFSTGLIFKNGRYFDPNTGIWITLSGMVVWNGWQTSVNNRNKKRPRRKRLLLLLLLFLVIITLAGCGDNSPANTPIPDPTETCTPTNVPTSTLPMPLSTSRPTIGAPNTPTPQPTTAPSPTWAPFPTPSDSDPFAGFQLANPLGENEPYYWVCELGAAYCGLPEGNHNGADIVSVSYISASCTGVPGCADKENPSPAAGLGFRKVFSPVTGDIKSRAGSTILFHNIKNNFTGQIISGLEVELTHVDITQRADATTVKSGEWLTYFMGEPEFLFPHLHIGMKYNGYNRNPLDWLNGSNVGYYFNADRQTLPKGM
jgi:predicted small lipoprotein YifL